MPPSRKQTQSIQDRVIAELDALPDKKRWEEWQDDIIRKYYGKKTTAAIAKVLGKAVSTVRGRAEILCARQ